MPPETDSEGLSDVIAQLRSLGDGQDRVSFADIREAFGNRSFGPFLLIPALLEISPIGGIPAVPTALAILISLFAVQILFGRKNLWLPRFIEQRSVSGRRLATAMAKIERIGRVVDRIVRPRLDFATHRPFVLVVALLTIAMCATVPVLELVPFASTLPMGAIALFGLGITARDGLLVLSATALSLAGFYATYVVLLS